MSGEPPVVLVVEDERDLADLYATWLRDDYDVRVAYGGEEALDQLDETVEIVLLDRRMPDLSGDEALREIRNRGFDCRVAMVTAVEPDFDILAMGFDDYLVKPVSKESLHQTVSNLLLRVDYDEGIQELFALASKKALLESEKDPSELADSEEYAELGREIDDHRAELDRTLETLSESDEMKSLYSDLTRGDAADVDEDGDD